MVHIDKYVFPVRGFMGREVTITLVVMFLVLLGSKVVPPDLPPVAVLTGSATKTARS